MDRAAAEIAIAFLIQEISARLDQAAAVGKGAQACAKRGHVAKGVAIAHDIEQLCHEASHLLNAVSLINRTSAGGQPIPD